MNEDVIDEIQATVTKIETAKESAYPWVAVAQTIAGPVRIFLKERPMREIKPGDELIFLAAELHRPPSPDGIPSITPHRDARSSVFAALMNSEAEVYRSATRAKEAGHVFGITDAVAWAKNMSMASAALATPGVTVLRRPDAEKEGDPIIKWVVSKFNDPTIASLRNAADIIVQPETVNAPERRTRRHNYPPVPSDIVAASLLPAYLAKDVDIAQSAIAVGTGISARAIRPFMYGKDHSVGIVFPYSMRETAIDQIFAISQWPTHCGIPWRLTCARSRFLLTAAHEMAHQLRLDIHTDMHREPARSDVDIVHRDEAFADALSIMLFVTETGAAGDARRLANMRSVAALTGWGHCHYTGAASHAAVDKGMELHLAHKGRSVPMRLLVEEAVRIALANPIAPVEDFKFTLAAVEALDPAWMRRDVQSIANLVGKAAEITAPKLEDKECLKRDMGLGLQALNDLFLVNPPVLSEEYHRRMGELARMDMQDHVEECKQIGGGGARAALEEIIDRTKLLSSQIMSEFGVSVQGGHGAWLTRGHKESRQAWPRHILDIMERQLTVPQGMYHAAILEHRKLTASFQPSLDEPIRPMFVATRRAPKRDWVEISPGN